MNFFSTLLIKRNLNKHDGRPLWKYLLNLEELNDLKKTLQLSASSVILDPRDVSMYYAQWWKRNYNGGIPSKQEVFESIEGNIKYFYNEEEFYKLAKKGAQLLGVKWIKKQNTLYFKTLLLQGGLPLKHISENQSTYKAFLEAVLEEQPETIEDFIFKTHITNLLPKSSQNDVIYENCFEIVKSILNEDGQYDQLLESEESLKEIASSLKIKRASLKRKVRQSKPKNYWLLSFKNNECKINLRLGLANKYTKEALSDIIGFDAIDRTYQFYMEDNLICIFRKMANGQFKTDWHNQENKEWDNAVGLPYAYVIDNNQKVEVKDFIQLTPNIEEPTLWSKFNDNEWRLIKGTTAANKEAAVLYPSDWHVCSLASQVTLFSKKMDWLPFEGEIILKSNEGGKRSYLSGVSSFDWIIESKKPKWMLKSNLPVVQGVPKVFVYDEDGYYINKNKFKVYTRRHNSKDAWENISALNFIHIGCYDLKIVKDELVTYDVYYNIGRLKAEYFNQSIFSAKIKFINPDGFDCELYDTELIHIDKEYDYFNLNTGNTKIPKLVQGALGYTSNRKLLFAIVSPFQGMEITDKDGQIIQSDQQISLANIYGMRLLSTPDKEIFLRIRNSLKRDVVITKVIKEGTQQPLISFKDEIVRLFYLDDAMDNSNKVNLELSQGNEKRIYKIAGFSHTLDVMNQLEREVSIFPSNDNLELFAVPLNCSSDHIDVIPLMENESSYSIPQTNISSQFIIISSKNEEYKLMPRFVNTIEFTPETVVNQTDIEVNLKIERIDNYHDELSNANFKDDIWKLVLAYFNICIQYDIPFSTFDQLRAISRSSKVASRAFLFLGINQYDSIEYIQKAIPEMEKDLGFCFHWIAKIDWENSIKEANMPDDYKYLTNIVKLVSSYMSENELQELFQFINGSNIDSEPVLQRNIIDLRSKLGERVLRELPYKSPKINNNYHIQIEEHVTVRLLLHAPIAVAESITNMQKEYTIWGGDEKREVIRRNIQYSQYLTPNFYNKTILHALNKI
tara:strand:- start:2249 stop:5302 length:3054 start_codon:yes stop_codon:yes gene_type:complete